MHKVLLFAVFALFLLTPTLVEAQAALIFDEVTIQVWPEFDQPAALVIVDLHLAENTPLPQTLKIRIPKGANLIAVALDSGAGQGLLTVPYEPPILEGEYEVLTLAITEAATYRLEYYALLTKNGATRNYDLIWPGDYAVQKLYVSVQKPAGARDLKTDPALTEALPAPDGFVYWQGLFENLAANQVFSLKVSYAKDDDSLSIEQETPQPGSSLDEAQGGSLALDVILPWVLAGLGILLVSGGVYWFWQSGQTAAGNPARRKRSPHATEEADNRVYCSQCGKRAEPGDGFCRACGARLRR